MIDGGDRRGHPRRARRGRGWATRGPRCAAAVLIAGRALGAAGDVWAPAWQLATGTAVLLSPPETPKCALTLISLAAGGRAVQRATSKTATAIAGVLTDSGGRENSPAARVATPVAPK
ncbi:hypothetical protein VIMS_00514 [Mycobacterium marinum]|nr:hypothetical protein VIMS_00514 [Mycobacterium marinum]